MQQKKPHSNHVFLEKREKILRVFKSSGIKIIFIHFHTNVNKKIKKT